MEKTGRVKHTEQVKRKYNTIDQAIHPKKNTPCKADGCVNGTIHTTIGLQEVYSLERIGWSRRNTPSFQTAFFVIWTSTSRIESQI
jgi:hypothetical protein